MADLSRKFEVSFGPIREAIRRLTGEGVLTFTAHKGASVRTFSEKEVREVSQAREAIDGYIVRLAAENIERADYREQLVLFGDELRGSMTSGCPEKSSAVRQKFHDILYGIAGNNILEEESRRFTFSVMRVRFNRLMGTSRESESLLEHELIIDAILSGEGIRAERLMRAHLRNGANAVCDAIEKERNDNGLK